MTLPRSISPCLPANAPRWPASWPPAPRIVAESLAAVTEPLRTVLAPGPPAPPRRRGAGAGAEPAPGRVRASAAGLAAARPDAELSPSAGGARPVRRRAARRSGRQRQDVRGAGGGRRAAADRGLPGPRNARSSSGRDVARRLGVPVEIGTHQQASRGRLPEVRAGLVIIDESHHFRNPRTRRYGHVAPWLIGRRVLLLSATPIVNQVGDLAAQLLLGVRDDALARRWRDFPALGAGRRNRRRRPRPARRGGYGRVGPPPHANLERQRGHLGRRRRGSGPARPPATAPAFPARADGRAHPQRAASRGRLEPGGARGRAAPLPAPAAPRRRCPTGRALARPRRAPGVRRRAGRPAGVLGTGVGRSRNAWSWRSTISTRSCAVLDACARAAAADAEARPPALAAGRRPAHAGLHHPARDRPSSARRSRSRPWPGAPATARDSDRRRPARRWCSAGFGGAGPAEADAALPGGDRRRGRGSRPAPGRAGGALRSAVDADAAGAARGAGAYGWARRTSSSRWSVCCRRRRSMPPLGLRRAARRARPRSRGGPGSAPTASDSGAGARRWPIGWATGRRVPGTALVPRGPGRRGVLWRGYQLVGALAAAAPSHLAAWLDGSIPTAGGARTIASWRRACSRPLGTGRRRDAAPSRCGRSRPAGRARFGRACRWRPRGAGPRPSRTAPPGGLAERLGRAVARRGRDGETAASWSGSSGRCAFVAGGHTAGEAILVRPPGGRA